jgi:hypothetical protein
MSRAFHMTHCEKDGGADSTAPTDSYQAKSGLLINERWLRAGALA